MRISDRTQFAHWLMCFILLLAVAGCGPSKPTVSGDISVDGAPLPMGSIKFVPLPGTAGGDAGTTISEGKYVIADGLAEGAYRIEIQGTRVHPTRMLNSPFPGGKPFHDEVQVVPREYNENSTLTHTVVAGKNTIDFELNGMESNEELAGR